MCHHLIGRRSKGSIESKYYSFSFAFFFRREKESKQRVRSLEDLLGAVHFHLVAWYLEWNLFACGGRSGNVWESASRKNRVARWKVSRWGFRPPSPGLHLIVEEGRWVEYQLSLSCLSSACSCSSIRDGAGSPHTWREKERGSKKWKQPMLWSFSWLLAVMLAKAGVSAGFTYYWIWTNDSRRMKAIL